jgi:superfamily II DNA or RNA helicase
MHAGERQSGGGHIAAAFGRTAAPYPLRTHQHRALDQIDRLMINGGRRRAWVVLPPGAGKTLVGLEAIRRLGRPAVVFGPNTAIQAQWVRQWEAFSPATVRVGVDRSLDSPITALTYQSLATFDADEEVDEEGHGSVEPSSHRGALLDRLHPNGRALFEELRAMARLTVVLDECHHLLEVWGRGAARLGTTRVRPRAHRHSRPVVDEGSG